jgi:hypothetical protein
MALGARAADLARRVTAEVFVMLFFGAAVGLAAGLASERMIATLLFEVKGTNAGMLALPTLTILATALLRCRRYSVPCGSIRPRRCGQNNQSPCASASGSTHFNSVNRRKS